jgi:SAM-dependent methyltransferase
MTASQLTRRLLTGLATYAPGFERLSERSTGGTDSAEYCYQVWLRHLILAHDQGLPTDPQTVLELGPGDSLGTGIAALLTGARTYIAVDLVEYAAGATTAELVGPLCELLSQRSPATVPALPDRPTDFPHDVLDSERLKASLDPERVRAVRAAAMEPGREHDGILVEYHAGPRKSLELEGTADLVFSQAVLEHVDDLEQAYGRIYAALRPGAYTSHTIDFKSHSFARTWDGHWTFSDRSWSLIRGRRRFAINRVPLSRHLELMETAGLEIVHVYRTISPSAIARGELAPRFRSLTDDDLVTASAVIQAVKR